MPQQHNNTTTEGRHFFLSPNRNIYNLLNKMSYIRHS